VIRIDTIPVSTTIGRMLQLPSASRTAATIAAEAPTIP
jgi:hypothetical protein